MNKANEIIDALQLKPHPEGGYYYETYRSSQGVINLDGHHRELLTVIYFLLSGEDKSHFHRVASDELWFFHQGQAFEIVTIESGQVSTICLGNDIAKGETPQLWIKAGTWFAARLKEPTGYGLVSCAVAPGFDFDDFALAERSVLTRSYPHLKEIIETYTRPDSWN